MSLAPSAHLDTFTRDNLPPADQRPPLIFSLPELQYPQQIAVAIHAAMGALAAQHDIGITGLTRQTRKKLNAGVTEIILALLRM